MANENTANNDNSEAFDAQMKARFVSLPKVVQDAITSADVEQHLRSLATTHRLHLDQWQVLENEVMLTLLGFQDPKNLAQSLKDDLGVGDEVAAPLAADISRIVFDPIRQELERSLEHPDAQAKVATGIEQAAAQALATGDEAALATAPAPLAPVPAAPETKAVRAPISETYKSGEASAARKDVTNDPYREPPA